MSLTPKGSDADPAIAPEDDASKLMLAQQRLAASLRQQGRAAKNWEPPQALYDPVTKSHYFIAAPTPLKSIFGPPLAPNSPNGKRRVSSGWGSARDAGYANANGPQSMNRRHAGLDFPGKVGEPVIASADGRVAFIGVHLRGSPSPFSIVKPLALKNGNVTGFDKKGQQIEIPHEQLGHGGMYVGIDHGGDFQNYTTQYMHLSAVAADLTEGHPVDKGQVIGAVGLTGGSSIGIVQSGSHVHWQVRYHGRLVKPEELVDFYMPGYTPSDQKKAFIVDLGDPNSSNGAALIHRQGAAQIQSVQRSNDAENQSPADHKKAQEAYTNSIATQVSVDAAKNLQAMAAFEQALPIVDGALAFDYDNGIWNDVKGIPPKAGEGF